MNVNQFFRDAGNVLLSNLLVALISGLNVLIIPKLIGVEQYGYWQLFLFVSSYTLLAQLGIGDGTYLRYGGYPYAQLARRNIGTQFVILAAYLVILAFLLIAMTHRYVSNPDRAMVFYFSIVFMVMANLRHFLNLLFQATAEFRVFRKVILTDRITFAVLVAFWLAFSAREVSMLMSAEIVAAVLSLGLALLYSRRVLKPLSGGLRTALTELTRNVTTGLKLTLANTGNMLIVGIARLAIDTTWGVVVFGMISLSWNLSMMTMILVNALGLVLFPMLRRMSPTAVPKFYILVRPVISLAALILLLADYPLRLMLTAWLPEYSDGLRYISLLMPLVVYEANMGLLSSPILKALRKENVLLAINAGALALSIVVTYLGTTVGSIDLIVLGMLLSIAARGIAGELVVHAELRVRHFASLATELFLVLISVASAWLIDGWWGSSFYFVALVGCIALRRKELSRAGRWVSSTIAHMRGLK